MFRGGALGRRPGLSCGPDVWEVVEIFRAESRDLAATAQKRGRPQADPRDRVPARLHIQMAKLEPELDPAKKLIEIQSELAAALGAR